MTKRKSQAEKDFIKYADGCLLIGEFGDHDIIRCRYSKGGFRENAGNYYINHLYKGEVINDFYCDFGTLWIYIIAQGGFDYVFGIDVEGDREAVQASLDASAEIIAAEEALLNANLAKVDALMSEAKAIIRIDAGMDVEASELILEAADNVVCAAAQVCSVASAVKEIALSEIARSGGIDDKALGEKFDAAMEDFDAMEARSVENDFYMEDDFFFQSHDASTARVREFEAMIYSAAVVVATNSDEVAHQEAMSRVFNRLQTMDMGHYVLYLLAELSGSRNFLAIERVPNFDLPQVWTIHRAFAVLFSIIDNGYKVDYKVLSELSRIYIKKGYDEYTDIATAAEYVDSLRHKDGILCLANFRSIVVVSSRDSIKPNMVEFSKVKP